MSCGRRGCWLAMCVDRRKGTPVLASWRRVRCCKILNEEEIKPHKVRYYPERRDPEFNKKMAEALRVYGFRDGSAPPVGRHGRIQARACPIKGS
jgi:hypothetical protein